MSCPSALVRASSGGPELDVRIVFEWERGDIPAPIMSTSSGMKDYFKNDIWSLFEKTPEADRIVLCRRSDAVGRRAPYQGHFIEELT